MEYSKIYGSKIAEARGERKMTQDELANKIGISRGRLGNYEQGSRQPDIDMIGKIADVLNKPLDYFFNRKPYESNDINLDDIHLPIAAGTQNDKNKGLDPELLKEIKEEIRSAILEVREERKNEQYGKK